MACNYMSSSQRPDMCDIHTGSLCVSHDQAVVTGTSFEVFLVDWGSCLHELSFQWFCPSEVAGDRATMRITNSTLVIDNLCA